MRKLHLILTALFAIAMQGHAQKFIDFYQEGQVTRSLLTSDIDSITITGAEPSMRRINIWRSGKVTESFSATAVDTIIVYNPEDERLIYLVIIGFNKSLYPKAIDILANSTSPLYSSFVSHLTREDGSLLYYSVDQAIDMLTKHPFSTPLSSVNLITFTDGLDQDSPQMTANTPDGNDYLIALSQRIGSTRVQGLPLTAYCLGLHGDDVTDDVQFQSNLRQLATSDENAIEVKSMSAVESHLQEIADRIISHCHPTVSNDKDATANPSGAIIMLVLDCSSSLGSHFSDLQAYVNAFISRLANHAPDFSIKPPTNVSVALDTENHVIVNWDAVKNAEHYSIFRNHTADSYFTIVADSLTSTTWCDNEPFTGANYYRVHAMGHGLSSLASNICEIEVPVVETPRLLAQQLAGTWHGEAYSSYYDWRGVKVESSGTATMTFSLSGDDATDGTGLEIDYQDGKQVYRMPFTWSVDADNKLHLIYSDKRKMVSDECSISGDALTLILTDATDGLETSRYLLSR